MDLVVDANVLFSALIKDSVTSDLLFAEEFHLYAPEFLLIEFEKYKEVILQKTHRTEEEFNRLMQILGRRIKTIPKAELEPFMAQARKVSPDTNDAAYFAVALRIGGAIWSNDKELKMQNKVKVYSTEEPLGFIEKK